MKKRLRKKRRRGEFREDCFELSFDVAPSLTTEQVDRLIDSFIDLIEENELQYGGGGDKAWSGIVQGPYRGTVTAPDREAIVAWLTAEPNVVSVTAGPLRDAWYGWG